MIKTVVLMASLFGMGLGAGLTLVPVEASVQAAKPRGCPYCRGDRCGRGTIGACSCTMTTDGCTEGGGCNCESY